MTLTLSLVLVGMLLVYAGWTNRSLRALLRGDNTTAQAAPNAPLAAA